MITYTDFAVAVLVALLYVLLGIVLGVAFLDVVRVVAGLVAVTGAVIVREPILGDLRGDRAGRSDGALALGSWQGGAVACGGGAGNGMLGRAFRYSVGPALNVGSFAFRGVFVHTFIFKSCKNQVEMP